LGSCKSLQPNTPKQISTKDTSKHIVLVKDVPFRGPYDDTYYFDP